MARKRQVLKRVAVVGFGFMGRMHYGHWNKVKGAKVVALCDKDPAQFKSPVQGGNLAGADASTDFGDAVIYDDFDRMLAEAKPDVISLTLPTPLHVPLTVKALQAGVSVLCEKPMALDASACAAMIKASQTAPNGAKLMIAQCLRFWPGYVFLKKLVDSRKYGKVVAASFRRFSALPGWGKGKSWFADERKSGGVALDLHIHDTDIVNWLFGVPRAVTSTAAYAKDGSMRHIATLYDVGGAAVTAEGSWAMTPTLGFEASYMVTFEKAVVVLDGKREKPLCVYPVQGDPLVPKLAEGDGYEYEIQWFMDRLCGKKVPCVTTPEQSRDSVRIVDAEKKSAKTGKTVRL
ncbi:MAG: Gfo/Idh/MocA family oxidoreductase [bacterium]